MAPYKRFTDKELGWALRDATEQEEDGFILRQFSFEPISPFDQSEKEAAIRMSDMMLEGVFLNSSDLISAGKFPKSNFRIALALNRLGFLARKTEAVAQRIYTSRARKEVVFPYDPQVCSSVSVFVFG
jgi:hypothetical protein